MPGHSIKNKTSCRRSRMIGGTDQKTGGKAKKLIDLLSVIDEEETVLLYNDYDEKLGCYDGKNAISEKYNDAIVHNLSTLPDNSICIIVYAE